MKLHGPLEGFSLCSDRDGGRLLRGHCIPHYIAAKDQEIQSSAVDGGLMGSEWKILLDAGESTICDTRGQAHVVMGNNILKSNKVLQCEWVGNPLWSLYWGGKDEAAKPWNKMWCKSLTSSFTLRWTCWNWSSLSLDFCNFSLILLLQLTIYSFNKTSKYWSLNCFQI